VDPIPEPNEILREIRALREDIHALPDRILKVVSAALWRLMWLAWGCYVAYILTNWLIKRFGI
jgi:hypothetical protein